MPPGGRCSGSGRAGSRSLPVLLGIRRSVGPTLLPHPVRVRGPPRPFPLSRPLICSGVHAARAARRCSLRRAFRAASTRAAATSVAPPTPAGVCRSTRCDRTSFGDPTGTDGRRARGGRFAPGKPGSRSSSLCVTFIRRVPIRRRVPRRGPLPDSQRIRVGGRRGRRRIVGSRGAAGGWSSSPPAGSLRGVARRDAEAARRGRGRCRGRSAGRSRGVSLPGSDELGPVGGVSNT